MKFRQLSLRCACGLAPARIQHVGLTAEHQLVIHWRCTVCKKDIYVLKTLADCWRECPQPEAASQVAEVGRELVESMDAEFLHGLGVKFPDEG